MRTPKISSEELKSKLKQKRKKLSKLIDTIIREESAKLIERSF